MFSVIVCNSLYEQDGSYSQLYKDLSDLYKDQYSLILGPHTLAYFYTYIFKLDFYTNMFKQ